jgi:PAS domain S-box-containing protein
MVMVDRQGVLLAVNEAFSQLVGRSEETLTGVRLQEWIHPDDLGVFVSLLFQASTTGTAFQQDHRYVRPDGSVCWVSFHGSVSPQTVGEPTTILGVVTDITERKQLELRHQRNEERFRSLLETTYDGIWEWDMATNEVFWNRRLYEMHGLDPATFSPTLESFMALVHPEDQPRVQEAIAQHLTDGIPYLIEIRQRHSNGQYKSFYARGAAMRDASGTPYRMVGATMDISQLRQAELTSKESEARFKHISDGAPVFMFMCDRALKAEFFNKTWLEYVGVTEAEVLGSSWERLIHPEDLPVIVETFTQALATQEPYTLENRLRRSDGEYRWILWHGVPRFLPNGEFIGYMGSGIEIHDRKQMEVQLQESEAQFRSLTETVPAFIFLTDASGHNDYVNQYYLDFLGMTYEEMMGLNWTTVIHPEDLEGYFQLYQQSSANRVPYNAQVRLKRHDGVYRWMVVNANPRYSANNQYLGYIGSCIDIHDQKMAELELKRSERRIRRLLEANAIGVLFWNQNGQLTDANDAFLDMVGYTRAELEAGQINWIEMTPPEFLHLDEIAIREIVQGRVAKPYEKQYFHKNGHRVDVMLGGASLDGEEEEGVAFIVDITARKQMENALRLSEERYQLIIDGSHDGVWDWDMLTNRVHTNQRYKEMLGVEQEIEVHRFFNAFIHPDDQPRVAEHLRRHMEEGEPYQCEFRLFNQQTQQYITVLSRGQVLKDRSGKPYRMAGVHTDLTERKQFENALLESEMRFRSIADLSPVMIWMTDPEGHSQYLNQAWEEFAGVSLASIQQTGWRHLVHPDDLPLVLEAFAAAVSNKSACNYECRLKSRTGEWRWVSVSGKPRYTFDGQFLGMLGSLVDISDLKRAKDLAEDASLRKSQFLANMSHELRTPLNAVIGYSEMMKLGLTGELNEKQKKYVHNIHISGKHLLAMVNDILDIAKIEAGRIQVRLEPIEVRTLVKALQEVMSPMAEEKGIGLSFELDPSLTHVIADPTRLKQVFFNLMSNAIKFNKPGGQVTVRMRTRMELDAPWFVAEVEDTGIGMPQDKMQELFSRFYQIDSSTARQYEGTGLGLALTRHLIELHEGAISVESEEGQGSRFTVRFPNPSRLAGALPLEAGTFR